MAVRQERININMVLVFKLAILVDLNSSLIPGGLRYPLSSVDLVNTGLSFTHEILNSRFMKLKMQYSHTHSKVSQTLKNIDVNYF